MPESADHGLGRSRGGLTTKVHLACEQGQKPLSIVITAGQRGNSPQFAPVLAGIRVPRIGGGRPRTRPDRVLADKAYTSRANRGYLRRHGIKATIPSKSDQDAHRRAKGAAGGRRPAFDPEIYKQRHARGMRHQPAQTPPRRGYPVRQACRALPSHHLHRRDQRMAVIDFDTDPSRRQ